MNKLGVVEYKQRDWPDWLVKAEFVVNNKVYVATKVLSFIANYERELRIKTDIRKKRKDEESNRVYRKYKKSIRKNRSSIKKNTRRDEETS